MLRFPEAVSTCMTSPYSAACHSREGLTDPGRFGEFLFHMGEWFSNNLLNK